MTNLERAKALLLQKVSEGHKVLGLRHPDTTGITNSGSCQWLEESPLDEMTEFILDDGTVISFWRALFHDRLENSEPYEPSYATYLIKGVDGRISSFEGQISFASNMSSGNYFIVNHVPMHMNDMSDEDVLKHTILETKRLEFYNWNNLREPKEVLKMKLTHKQTETLIKTEIAAGQHVTYISNVPMDYSNPSFVQRDIPENSDELRGIHHPNNSVIYADYSDASAEAKEALQYIYSDKNPRLVFVEFV